MEYLFYAADGEDTVEIWSFYLTRDGKLLSSYEDAPARKICDFNNAYVGERLLSLLNIAALSSPLFAPRKVRG